MLLLATHHTRYEYPIPSIDSHNEARLRPLDGPHQKCLRFDLDVLPHASLFPYEDVGGTVYYFSVREQHSSLNIVASALVEMLPQNPFDRVNLNEPDWEFYDHDETRQTYAEFLSPSPYVVLYEETEAIACSVRGPEQSSAQFLLALNRYLFETLEYDPLATNVHTPLAEVLEKKAGVCQDYAHLMIACCRTQGIPTRYVSGYLYGGEGIRGEQGTHAWIECLLPDGRWLALDPTNNILANDHHIRVHVGRDYSDVSPTRGVYVGAPCSRLEYGVSVVQVSTANC
jgi:transglutaminase-like putative cysteine protease